MCEVNAKNFRELFPEIKNVFKEAKFFSIDLEFSALHPDHAPSLFDTTAVRYNKLKSNIETIIPLQVGLTAFSFNPEENCYCGRVYTFYVQPACFQHIHRNFTLQTRTLDFLKLYNFDFNKFAYDGIPYLNKNQATKLRQKIIDNEVSDVSMSCRLNLEDILANHKKLLDEFFNTAKIDEHTCIPKVCTDCLYREESIFFLHKALRETYQKPQECLWTYVEGNEFFVKKVSKQDFDVLNRKQPLVDITIDNLLGFSKLFDLLTKLKKPIIGHNILQDLLLMIDSFESGLPDDYDDFKKLVNGLFPVVFDTKCLSYDVKKAVPEDKVWNDRGLDTIFDYFQNGAGRNLAPNSPAIDMQDQTDSFGKFHDAGWDSFCAGYVFIRLAHLKIFKNYPSSKIFVSSELIGGVGDLKNRVNIIRGSVSHINLDGADPESTRPPFLLIESTRNTKLTLAEINSLLSKCGWTEVKLLPYQNTKAIIAVDNHGNARKILNIFKNHPRYSVKKYNFLKHSPLVKVMLLGSLTISSALILFITHSVLRK